jgi:hypothetical protein
MGQVVTELVIDANTAGADQFSQAMDKASSSAQSGTSSVAGMSLAVAGVGIAVVGALAGLKTFYDYVGTTNKQLIDIAENADNAGMSAKQFQQSLFAARAAGLSEKDFVSGLDKISADLTAASRGVTEFGRLFDANGISIRQANGELKTASVAIGDIMGLMQNQTPQVAAAVARIVGVSKDWIPLLRQGSDEFERQKQAAGSLGIIIDDDVIAKAKDFDREWKTAVASWDLQFKASLAGIMPLLVQMAGLASTIIEGVSAASSTVSRWMTSDENKSKSQLESQIADVERLRDSMVALGDTANGFQQLKINNLKGLLGLPEDADLARVDQLIVKLTELHQGAATQLTVHPTAKPTVLPDIGGDGNDAVDRAINALRRHVEQQNADTLAIGQGAGALARFRAIAAETAAVQANGGKETADQAAKFASLRNEAEAVAAALARVKVANENSFNAKTAFLSQDDLAIASQAERDLSECDDRAQFGRGGAAALSITPRARCHRSIENDLVGADRCRIRH